MTFKSYLNFLLLANLGLDQAFLSPCLQQLNTWGSSLPIANMKSNSRSGLKADNSNFKIQSTMNLDSQKKRSDLQKIVILGGGFGGFSAASNLAQLLAGVEPKVEIYLVDSSERFVFLPFLYELVTGELKDWEVAPLYSDLLTGSGVNFFNGKVTSLDLQSKTVSINLSSLEGGDTKVLQYDRVVVALGGEPKQVMVPGAVVHALPFHRLQDARRLREKLNVLELKFKARKGRHAEVVVVGGGPSGVELASSLADRVGDWGRISLVHAGTEVLSFAEDFTRKTAQEELKARGIRLFSSTRVASVSSESVTLQCSSGESVEPVDLVIWTCGTSPCQKISGLGKERLKVSSKMQVLDEDGVYALGDIVECYDDFGDRVPATAQVAIQQADVVSWNIFAEITGQTLVKFRFQNLGEMITFGRFASSLSSDVFGIKLSGPSAHFLRRLTYLIRMPSITHRKSLMKNWTAGIPGELLKLAGWTRK